jgi:hypothetical protein
MKWWHDVIVEAVDHHWTSILDIWNMSEHYHMLWIGIWVHPYTVTPVEVNQIMANWRQHSYYEMAWWHCWDCRPPLNASHIHIRYIKSVWAPSYAVDRHMGAPLHCYTAKLAQILVIWVSVATMKWWHDDILEAVDHHWLLSTSILDVQIVFEHHHMLLIGIWVHHPYTVTPGKVGPDFGKLGSVWL